jgi:tetratricopeptide (TPR) repeat protein
MRHASAALVVITAGVAIGCARQPVVDRAALKTISLPDLSLMEPQVQRQIQDQYAALTSKSGSAATPQDELAAEYGAMGKLLLSAESLGAAETCLQNAQTLAPGEPRWPYYLGHLHKARAETEKSVAAFARALELQPADVATLVWLGNAYLDEDRAELAEPVFTKALSIQPQSGAAMSGLGRAALARRDYAEAVRKLEAALALSPQASAIEYPLSLGYRGLGDAGKADAHLRRRGDKEPIPIDPWMDEVRGLLHSVVASEKRGLRALDGGDYRAAIESLRQGLIYAPDNTALRHELGTALYLSGDAKGALNEFTEITRRSPGFAKAHYSLGMLLASQGRVGDAVERFAAAVKADPDYPAAEFQLAEALRRTGRTAESLSHYTHVIKADPKTAEVRIGYAMALGRLGRYLEARRALTDAMQAIPDQPSLGQALARVLAAAPNDRVRDGRQAVAITQALMQKPHSVDLYEAVAMSLAELGQYDQAVQWQRGAIAAAMKEGHAELGDAMAANLRLYESHMPCRTPWRNDQ